MGDAVFDGCIIDKDTTFGRRPDNHPKAKPYYDNDPAQPLTYRGGGKVVLKTSDLTPWTRMKIIAAVKAWQRNGLELDIEKSDRKIYS